MSEKDEVCFLNVGARGDDAAVVGKNENEEKAHRKFLPRFFCRPLSDSNTEQPACYRHHGTTKKLGGGGRYDIDREQAVQKRREMLILPSALSHLVLFGNRKEGAVSSSFVTR